MYFTLVLLYTLIRSEKTINFNIWMLLNDKRVVIKMGGGNKDDWIFAWIDFCVVYALAWF